jgi:elongation factor 3
MLPDELSAGTPSAPNGPKHPKYSILETFLKFQAGLVADLVDSRNFHDTKTWNRCVASYMTLWVGEPQSVAFAEVVLSHYLAIDQVNSLDSYFFKLSFAIQAKHSVTRSHNEAEGELLCDTLFSLAYGALLLLSHTTLRLIRGRRYGILGANGSGKSTLMRQLRDGKVENFPPQEQLRCVMVEHSLQGEDGSLSVLDFIAAGWYFFFDLLRTND